MKNNNLQYSNKDIIKLFVDLNYRLNEYQKLILKLYIDQFL